MFLRSRSGYFRALFFFFFIVLFHRNVIEEAHASCPWEKIKKERWTGDSSARKQSWLIRPRRESRLQGRERREKRRSTGNRILRPADQTSHCPSMSERIYLWLDEWAVIVATIGSSSRNVKVWNNYNGRVNCLHTRLYSRWVGAAVYNFRTSWEQHQSNISVTEKKGKVTNGSIALHGRPHPYLPLY